MSGVCDKCGTRVNVSQCGRCWHSYCVMHTSEHNCCWFFGSKSIPGKKDCDGTTRKSTSTYCSECDTCFCSNHKIHSHQNYTVQSKCEKCSLPAVSHGRCMGHGLRLKTKYYDGR